MDNNERRSIGIVFGGLAAAIWSGFPIVSKLGLASTLTPYDITALRFAVAGPLLLPWLVRRGLGAVGAVGAAVLAVGAGAPYIVLAAGGLAFAPAGHFGVITPGCMLLFSALGSRWLGDASSRSRLLGVLYTRAVAVLGAARGALFGALVPGLALLLAVPVLGEVPSGLQLVGVAVVTVGMAFALGLFGAAVAKQEQ